MRRNKFVRPVSVVMTKEMFNQAKFIADSRDIAVSEFIRESIYTKLKNKITR